MNARSSETRAPENPPIGDPTTGKPGPESASLLELDAADRETLSVLDLLSLTAADRDRDTEPLVDAARQLAERHGRPRSVAVLGAAILVDARDDYFWNQIGALDDGGARLDQAVELDPSDRLVRFLRAVATFPLPAIAGRKDACAEDLAILYRDLGTPDALWTEARQALTCCMHAVMLEDSDAEGRGPEAAIVAYERALELGPDSPAGRLAADRLAERRASRR